jgi:uncharacterized membrane protein YccC
LVGALIAFTVGWFSQNLLLTILLACFFGLAVGFGHMAGMNSRAVYCHDNGEIWSSN